MTSSHETSLDDPARQCLAEHAEAFRERFGTGAGVRCFFSPGRVNLMGAHLDYSGGPVMPTAIDRGTFLAVRPRSDLRVRLASTVRPVAEATDPLDGIEVELDRLPAERTGRWVDYPLGTLRELLERATQHEVAGRVTGLDVLFGGNLPIGAGLSSSASICVGTAFCCDALWGTGLARLELVDAALAGEHGFVGVQCGIMDPYAVGLARSGHLLWLDCKDRSFEHLPLDVARLQIAVADTGVRRELAESAFNQRVAEAAAAFEALRPFAPAATCLRDVPLTVLAEHRAGLDPTLARRAEHVLHEVERTFTARDAPLQRGEPEGFGAAMTRSHASLRDLYDVSVPELDQLVESATATPGVLGARLTGAGFGGCAVILLERGSAGALEARLTEDFERRFGRVPKVELFGGDPGPREL